MTAKIILFLCFLIVTPLSAISPKITEIADRFGIVIETIPEYHLGSWDESKDNFNKNYSLVLKKDILNEGKSTIFSIESVELENTIGKFVRKKDGDSEDYLLLNGDREILAKGSFITPSVFDLLKFNSFWGDKPPYRPGIIVYDNGGENEIGTIKIVRGEYAESGAEYYELWILDNKGRYLTHTDRSNTERKFRRKADKNGRYMNTPEPPDYKPNIITIHRIEEETKDGKNLNWYIETSELEVIDGRLIPFAVYLLVKIGDEDHL